MVSRGTVRRALTIYRSHDYQMHHDLIAFERESRLILDEYFARVPRDRRRGLANLHTRLAYFNLGGGSPMRHVRIVARNAPLRLVALPLEALRRRTWRWLRYGRTTKRFGPPDS